MLRRRTSAVNAPRARASLPWLAGGLLVFAGLALGPGPASAANTGFVRAQGGQFVLNGAPFRFVGTNAYYLQSSGSFVQTDETMSVASALGMKVLRIWGFNDGAGYGPALQPAPGVYDETSFRALDYVLYRADQAGIRLILVLVNRWADFGGMPQYVRWCAPGQSEDAFYTQPACRDLYRRYVSHVLNRVNTYNGRPYRTDPTIFAWELANEPTVRDGTDSSGQIVRNWVAEMAAHVKSIDPNHMVGTGEEGYDTTAAGYSPISQYSNQQWLLNGWKGVSFTQNTAVPDIDFGSIHFYPEYWNLPAAAGPAWVRDHIRIARNLGKPLLVGEFGHSSNAGPTYDSWLGTWETEQGGGALVWQLMCPSCNGWRDQFGILYPPDSDVSRVLATAAARAGNGSGYAQSALPGLYVAAGDVDGVGALEIVTGRGGGALPLIQTYRADGTDAGVSFLAYDPAFRGGARVASCNVDSDPAAEIITAAGPGGGPHVRVWKRTGGNTTELFGFYAYDPAFTGGVFVACGDLDRDGRAEIITGADTGGGPHVRVFKWTGSSLVELFGFFAYDLAFRGGVRVAVCDVDQDGWLDIVTAAGPGGGPHVRVFRVGGGPWAELASFYAYDSRFAGGVYVGCAPGGKVITGAGVSGGPHVRVIQLLPSGGLLEAGSFFAYDPAFTGGVRVAGGDGGSLPAVVTAPGPSGGPHIRGLTETGAGTASNFMAH